MKILRSLAAYTRMRTRDSHFAGWFEQGFCKKLLALQRKKYSLTVCCLTMRSDVYDGKMQPQKQMIAFSKPICEHTRASL